MALEDAYHEEVGTVGLNHTKLSRLAQWLEVVAVVIRQDALNNCLWQMFWGANGK